MRITLENIHRTIFITMVLMVCMFNYSTNSMLDMLTNVSVVLFVGITFISADWNLNLPRECKYFFVFMVFCIVSILYSTSQNDSVNRAMKLLILMMEFVAVYVYARDENKDFVLKVIAICTAVTALFIDIKGFSVIGNTRRVNYITGNSNQVSAYLALGILVMIYLLITRKMRIYVPIAGIALSIIAIILQGSRTGILIAGTMSVLEVLFLSKYMNFTINKKIGIILFLSLVGTLTIYYIFSNPILYMTLGRRIVSFYEIQTSGTSSINETSAFKRSLSYKLAFERFLSNPFFGKGIDSFMEYSLQTDLNRRGFCPCNYLELLQGIGIIGTTAYYLVYFSALKKSVKARATRIDSSSVLLICILLAMLLVHLTVVFYYQKLEYLYLGTILAICFSFTQKSEEDIC